MSDGRRLLLTALLAAWAICFCYAFVAYVRAPYEGPGFPDGLNKPAVFFGWQGIAAMLSLAVWGVSLGWPRGSGARRVARVPLVCSLAVLAVLLALVVSAGGF